MAEFASLGIYPNSHTNKESDMSPQEANKIYRKVRQDIKAIERGVEYLIESAEFDSHPHLDGFLEYSVMDGLGLTRDQAIKTVKLYRDISS